MFKVDQDKCLRCGMCAANIPDVLEFNDEGNIEVNEENLNEESIKELKEFIETNSCPVNAISEEKVDTE